MIFRLQENGDTNLNGWGEINNPINPDSITSNFDGNPNYPITSIPSPFARMSLVKEAFEYVYDRGVDQLQTQNNIYYKTVSDTLDILELLFNYPRFRDQIQIQTWNQAENLIDLVENYHYGTSIFGRTINLFLNQDAESNNFQNGNNKFYLVKYNNSILGGSSNKTFFFSSANQLYNPNNPIQFNEDVAFDDNYNPLFLRSTSFQKYVLGLFKGHPGLQTEMTDFYSYLELNLQALERHNNQLYDEIINIDPDYNLNHNIQLNVEGQQISIMDCPLFYRENVVPANFQSDLYVQTRDDYEERRPLLISSEVLDGLVYCNEQNWNANFLNQIPEDLSPNIAERTLPGLGALYPFITKNDLLEDTIVKVPYVIDQNHYCDGGLISDTGTNYIEVNGHRFSYLLPIKPLYLKLFSVDELRENLNIRQINPRVVEVRLTISIINNRTTTLIKRYVGHRIEDNRDEGEIREAYLNWSLCISPFIRRPDRSNLFSIQSLNIGGTCSNLTFYNQGEIVESENAYNRRSSRVKSSIIYRIRSAFDAIGVEYRGVNALVVPLMNNSVEVGQSITYAIDFGTSNTHIEYQIEQRNPEALTYRDGDTFIRTIFDKNLSTDNFNGEAVDLKNYIRREFLPLSFMAQDEMKFPTSSMILETPSDDQEAPLLFLDKRNIGFDFVQILDINPNDTNRYYGELKWDERPVNQNRMKEFFNQLLFMVRNHALVNGHNVDNLDVIWFHPTSMSIGQVNTMQGLWNNAFQLVFGNPNGHIRFMPETAPFYYLRHMDRVDAGNVNASFLVDIGGGSSDIVLFSQGAESAISSIRFAGDDVWGGDLHLNQFDSQFTNRVSLLINQTHEDSQLRQFETFPPLISLLFKVENSNTQVQELAPTSTLGNSRQLKILFIYFFYSIIYYVGEVARQNNNMTIGSIAFSGNGSKILNFITNNIHTLTGLSRAIFNSINENFDTRHHIIYLVEHPKEVCSKGGLYADNENIIGPEEIRNLAHAYNFSLDSEDNIEGDIQELVELLISDLNHFHDVFFGVHESYDLEEYFNADLNTLDSLRNIVEGLNYEEILTGYVRENMDNQNQNRVYLFDMVKIIINHLYRNGVL